MSSYHITAYTPSFSSRKIPERTRQPPGYTKYRLPPQHTRSFHIVTKETGSSIGRSARTVSPKVMSTRESLFVKGHLVHKQVKVYPSKLHIDFPLHSEGDHLCLVRGKPGERRAVSLAKRNKRTLSGRCTPRPGDVKRSFFVGRVNTLM